MVETMEMIEISIPFLLIEIYVLIIVLDDALPFLKTIKSSRLFVKFQPP